jgi:uncharacterized damage-inducible protein DinB
MKAPNPKLGHFITQFAALYDGHPWYGDAICQLFESVTPAKAYWQPTAHAHSIAQLVSHMIYWRQALIKRLEGDLAYKPSMKSEENWKSNEQLKKIGWTSLKKSLDESQSKLLALLSNQKDALLKKNYSEKASYQDLINGILQHDLYHTGQIAYLKSIYPSNKK